MDKIKQTITTSIESDKGKDILTVIIIILVGLSSFGLGRLSKSNTSSGIKIEYGEELNNQGANVISTVSEAKTASGSYFASNRGSKYYPISCSAGKDIKMENRIYFNTKEEAEGAGYALSSSCK